MTASSTVSRRDRLVDAALTVFAREGVDAASIKKIGQAAGVAPALIYHYFESKEALLAAVVARHGFLPQLHRLLAVPVHSASPTRAMTMSGLVLLGVLALRAAVIFSAQ